MIERPLESARDVVNLGGVAAPGSEPVARNHGHHALVRKASPQNLVVTTGLLAVAENPPAAVHEHHDRKRPGPRRNVNVEAVLLLVEFVSVIVGDVVVLAAALAQGAGSK